MTWLPRTMNRIQTSVLRTRVNLAGKMPLVMPLVVICCQDMSRSGRLLAHHYAGCFSSERRPLCSAKTFLKRSIRGRLPPSDGNVDGELESTSATGSRCALASISSFSDSARVTDIWGLRISGQTGLGAATTSLGYGNISGIATRSDPEGGTLARCESDLTPLWRKSAAAAGASAKAKPRVR